MNRISALPPLNQFVFWGAFGVRSGSDMSLGIDTIPGLVPRVPQMFGPILIEERVRRGDSGSFVFLWHDGVPGSRKPST